MDLLSGSGTFPVFCTIPTHVNKLSIVQFCVTIPYIIQVFLQNCGLATYVAGLVIQEQWVNYVLARLSMQEQWAG